MTVEMDRLQREVQETKAAVDEALQRIQDLADYMRNNAADPAALTAMADALDADQADIVQKLLDNPVPPPPPVP